jgi:hypothetical protein
VERDVHRAHPEMQAGRGGWLMELGVRAGEWSALPCGSAAPPPAERDYPLAKGSNNTHTHTRARWLCCGRCTSEVPPSLGLAAFVARGLTVASHSTFPGPGSSYF